MSDIAEPWSVPWHRLQRSLAAGFDQTGPVADATPFVAAVSCRSGRPLAPACASWLSQARSRARPPHNPAAK